MKKIFPVLLLAVAFVLVSFKAEEKEKFPAIKNGSKIPLAKVEMLDVSGKKLSLQNVKKEKGTLVVFSSNTCPFVVQWEDRYRDLEMLTNRLNVGLVFINSNENQRQGVDSYEAMKELAQKNAYQAPYLVDEDSKLANAFGAKTTPHIFLFDAEDKLVYQGSIDDNSKDKNEVKEKYLQNALYNMANGNPIEPAETKAVGCSIKRVK
jgi:thioredoxin-related protein